MSDSELCVQCEANARYNEAGGYNELAEECREYCRRGHREAAALASVDGGSVTEGETSDEA